MNVLLTIDPALRMAGTDGNIDPHGLVGRLIGDSRVLTYQVRLNYCHYRHGCIMVPVVTERKGVSEFRVVLMTAQGGCGFFEPKLPPKEAVSGIEIPGEPIEWWRSLCALPVIDILSDVAFELECRTSHRPDKPFFVMVPIMDKWGTRSFVQAEPFRRP